MGLLVLALAKLHLAATSAHSTVTLPVTALVWPFILKLGLSLRPLHETYASLLRSSRLFLFQLVQIAFNPETVNIHSRWDRALRLVAERLTQARRWREYDESDEESLRNLSMLAL